TGPVDGNPERFTRSKGRLIGGGNMDDLVLGLAGDGRRDLDTASIGAFEVSRIARLPAGRRVENGAVEDDAATIVDGQHTCRRLLQIGIVAKEGVCAGFHHSTCSYGTSIPTFFSIQPGTG